MGICPYFLSLMCEVLNSVAFMLLNVVLNLLFAGCEAYNLGTGRGTSVLEIVQAFEKASGKVYKINKFRPCMIISILQCSLLRFTALISFRLCSHVVIYKDIFLLPCRKSL